MKAERVPIAGIDEIYQYADRLKATIGHYVQERAH
jgi:hypothetical protein